MGKECHLKKSDGVIAMHVFEQGAPAMDRIEAYKLLTEQMKNLAQAVPRPNRCLLDAETEFDVMGESGTRYHVEMVVEQVSDQRFAVRGKIHDNNSYQFTLMEERMEFDPDNDS